MRRNVSSGRDDVARRLYRNLIDELDCCPIAGGLWMSDQDNQKQVNVRMGAATVALLDECRIKKRTPQGNIPTRSDIVREAVEEYLKRETVSKPDK